MLSPSIALRNRFDTYGVDLNNASIVLRLEYPIPKVELEYPNVDEKDRPIPEPGPPVPAKKTRSIILGGDAQTDAWSQVLDEFPHLVADDRNWARQIGARKGRQPLACDVLKISHHFSKNGINLELVERMGDSVSGGASKGPDWIVGSCSSEQSSSHGFPHGVTQEIVREVREPLVKKRRLDPALLARHGRGARHPVHVLDDRRTEPGAGRIDRLRVPGLRVDARDLPPARRPGRPSDAGAGTATPGADRLDRAQARKGER